MPDRPAATSAVSCRLRFLSYAKLGASGSFDGCLCDLVWLLHVQKQKDEQKRVLQIYHLWP